MVCGRDVHSSDYCSLWTGGDVALQCVQECLLLHCCQRWQIVFEKKNGKNWFSIYLLICFVYKCFCTERKLILLLIIKYYQFKMSNCRKSSHSPIPCSVLNTKDFSPHQTTESDHNAIYILLK
jgi:hypothetical protein